MRELLLVGSGGFLGSVARYLMSMAVSQTASTSRFPFGTLAVNALGCLIMGALAGVAEQSGALSANTRLLLFTGVLGGFTTYSAFAYESWLLGRDHAWALAAANIFAQLILGLGAVVVGHQAATLAVR